MDPKFDDQYGNVLSTCATNLGNSVLSDSFQDGCAQHDGFSLPYPTFVTDFGGSATVQQALTPYPQYNYIFNNFEGFGTTYYQGAQITLEKRFSSGLAFLTGYTLSRLMDNTNSGFSSFTSGGINKYNQKPEYTISNSDTPQTLKVSGTYELPIGPGKKFVNNRKLGNVAGGWQVGWILNYQAGTPMSGCSSSSVCESGSPFPNGFNRPDRNSSVKLSTASYSKVRDYFTAGGTGTGPSMFDPAGFTTTPTQYVIGNAQRIYGDLRNPAYLMENLNARKHFYMGERFQAILQVDYFNAFNRTRFNGPDENASNGTFTQDTSTGSQINNRQGQVKVQILF
jgi:hypothetical protein